MQFAGTKKPAVGILYDSDFGASIDSILALALLHGLEGKTQARIAALTISNSDLRAAQLCDVIEKFYASATTGQAAMFLQSLPIGLVEKGPASERELCRTVLAKTDDSGKAVYSARVRKLYDTAIPEVLMRNALSAQYDGNAAIVSSGPPVNLMRLLALSGAKDLIAAKVRLLVVSGPVNEQLAATWPSRIAFATPELGQALPYPGASIEQDYGYARAHPVADAYRAFHAMPYDAPAPTLAAALYAALPDKGYFTVAKSGVLSVTPDQKETVMALCIQLASAKPKPRIMRRPVVDVDKADEIKATEKATENKVAP